jgi:ankyrin repeat protein
MVGKKERPVVDRMGRSPLHYAALDGKMAVAQRLLTKGADPSTPDDKGWTPLHFAVQDQRLAMVKLAAWAHPKRKNKYGVSPLSLARDSDDPSALKFLERAPKPKGRKPNPKSR